MKNTLVGLIGAGIVLLILFVVWPGFTTTLAIGVVAGVLIGNLFPKVEAWAEAQLERLK